MSKNLILAEQNYSTSGKECLFFFWARKKLRPYVEGRQLVFRSDHDALRWMMNIADSHGSLASWSLSLANLDFTVVYRPGLVNQVPDVLSRLKLNKREDEEVYDGIPTCEANKISIARKQSQADRPIEDGDEELDAYEEMGELNADKKKTLVTSHSLYRCWK